jgi:hypothetical protein
MGDFSGHGLNAHADGKILAGALGLCTPVTVSGHLNFAHGIMFNTVLHGASP